MNRTGDIGNLHIRRLWPVDLPTIRSHLRRLDPATRRSRFGGAIGDDAIDAYASRILRQGSIVCGVFVGAELRAIGELRGRLSRWPATAEAAFSVEAGWQNLGIGDALFGRLAVIARNRGVETLHLVCAKDNARMRHLAAKHHARLDPSADAVEATLRAPWPTPLSLAREFAGEARGLAWAWHHRPGDGHNPAPLPPGRRGRA